MESVKTTLIEDVILPVKYQKLYEGIIFLRFSFGNIHICFLGFKPRSSILLFGPLGTGKSLIVKALASEARNSTFISISPAHFFSRCREDSEQ